MAVLLHDDEVEALEAALSFVDSFPHASDAPHVSQPHRHHHDLSNTFHAPARISLAVRRDSATTQVESNDAALMPDDAQSLRLQTLADEHLMICLCGVDVERDLEAQVLEDAVLKIIRIKLQMGNHQISLAKVHDSQIAIVQEFTRNVETLVAAVPNLLRSEGEEDVVDLDSLLANTAHYFGALRDAGRSLSTSFRMLLVFRQVSQTPQLLGNQNEAPHPPAYQLDVIYWHRDVPMEAAQSAFDQLCAYDSTNPFSKFYFLEVGGSVERLHQVLVLALSHPAHRLGQNAAEQFLGSWLSPCK